MHLLHITFRFRCLTHHSPTHFLFLAHSPPPCLLEPIRYILPAFPPQTLAGLDVHPEQPFLLASPPVRNELPHGASKVSSTANLSPVPETPSQQRPTVIVWSIRPYNTGLGTSPLNSLRPLRFVLFSLAAIRAGVGTCTAAKDYLVALPLLGACRIIILGNRRSPTSPRILDRDRPTRSFKSSTFLHETIGVRGRHHRLRLAPSAPLLVVLKELQL